MQNKKVDGFVAQNKHKFEYYYDVLGELAGMTPEETYAKSPLVAKSTTDGCSGFPCLLVICGTRVNLLKVSQLLYFSPLRLRI